MKQRILLQTIFIAIVFMAIGTGFGYYLAHKEAADKILTELSK